VSPRPQIVVAADEPAGGGIEQPVIVSEVRVLLVEDDDIDAEMVLAYLEAGGVAPAAVTRASRLDAALGILEGDAFDCVLLDLGLPDAGGLDAIHELMTARDDVAVVVLTGDADVEHATAAVAAGAQDYLVKGTFGAVALVRSVRYAVQRQTERRERIRLVRALQRERDRLAEVQRAARIGGWACDPATGEIELSPEALALFLAPPNRLLDAAAFGDLVHTDDRQAAAVVVRKALAGDTVDRIIRLVPRDGLDRWVRVHSAPNVDDRDRPWGTVQDVTEQVELDRSRAALQRRLERGQRLATLGQLAGGVAHDINNLIAVMGMGTSIARELLPPDHPASEQLTLVADAVARASALTAQMLVLGRRDEPTTVLSAGAVIGDLETLLRSTAGDAVDVVVTVDPRTPHVRIGRSQLEQLLINLTSNARDAMPDGGTLTIDVAAVGDRVRLRVGDTGIGMDAAMVERLFEPFFTTKPVGEGTGLGLALVLGTVEAVGGEVEVHSAPGAGTTVDVLLPGVAAMDAPAPRPALTPARRVSGATILVVDDHAPIATLVSQLLTRDGHVVMTATSATEASELAAAAAELDLVITDVVMRDLSGRDLAAMLRRARPDLAVIFMSGYTADVFGGDELGAGEWFLRKPFSDVELREIVERALQHDRR
jgi:two-component system, cell cycle sensor histidine kinase and response regulator CckA